MGEKDNKAADTVETTPKTQIKGLTASDFTYDKKKGAATNPEGWIVSEEFKGWRLQDPDGLDIASWDKSVGHWVGSADGKKVVLDDQLGGFKPDPGWFDPDAWTSDGKLKDTGSPPGTKESPGFDSPKADTAPVSQGQVDTAGQPGGTPSGGNTQEKPASGGQGSSDVYVQPNTDAAGRAGPLDHKRPKGTAMGDPNGHCIACGWELEPGATHCDHCGQDFKSWDKVINDFLDGYGKLGASPKQIQAAWDETFGQWRAEGLQHDFWAQQQEQEFKKTLDELG